jgi:type IV secretory pathway component VirB8
MQKKESDEQTKFIKDPEDKTQQFILQKNRKTLIASVIILVFLLLLVAAIVLSGLAFE